MKDTVSRSDCRRRRRLGVVGVLAVAAAVLVLSPSAGLGEPLRTPGALTGIPVDRAATAAAARQFLPGEPVGVDWEEPTPRLERPRRQFRSRATTPRPDIAARAAPPPLPTAEVRRRNQRARLIESRLASVERRIDALPRQSTVRRITDPGRESRVRARAMTLDLKRRSIAFEARVLSTPLLPQRGANARVGVRSGRR